MQRFQIFKYNRLAIKIQCTFIGVFFVLLFPLLGQAQFKSYDNSNFTGAVSVREIPVVTYKDTCVLAINYPILPIAPVFVTNNNNVITNASISPALPSGLSINNAGVISGSTSVLMGYTRYVITFGNSCGNAATKVMWIKTAVGPNIIKQTFCSDTICNTSDVQSFFIEATGTNLRYQWRKDGIPITNGILNGSFIMGAATSQMSIFQPVAFFANANYDVIISNDECSIISAPKSFKMLNAPAITAQPQAPNRVCEKNGIQTISVSANSSNTITYQWRKDGAAIIDTGIYIGTSTRTLKLTNPALSDTGNYTVVVADNFCPNYSNEVPVKLNFVRFVGITNLTDTVFCEGQQDTKSLGFTTVGTNIWYQWRQFGAPYNGYEGGIEGSEYSGSSTSTLTIANPTARNGGTYTVYANSGSCRIQDRATGKLAIMKNPQITRELSGESVQIGINVTPFDGLKLNFTAKGENPTFIWRRNGIPIPESELNSGSLYVKYVIRDPVDIRDWSEVFSASLYIKQASYEITEGTYDVVVKTLGCVNDTSVPYVVRFNRVPTTITRHPQVSADYLCSNEDVYLRVKATGANLSYTWRRNGEILNTIPSGQNGVQGDWVLFPGDTMLLIRGTYNNNTEGIYDVLISGAAEPVFSNPTTLRRYPAPQLLTENNNQFYFCRKDSNIITIKAKAMYGDSLGFTWNVPSNNSQRINGQVLTTYNGDYVNFSTPISKNLANGTHQYTVTNHCGQTETRYVQIQFNGEPSDSLDARVVVPSLACNRAANLTLTTAGTSTNTGLIYQWQKDGIDLSVSSKYSNSTSRNLIINNLTFEDSGYYELNLKYPLNQGGCKISSGKTFLKIDSNSTIIAAPVRPPATFTGDGVQTLSVVAHGNNLNYTWSRDWNNITNNAVFSGQGTPNLTITNSSDDQGLYRVVVTGACLMDIDSTVKSSITLSPVTLRFFTRIFIASQPTEFSTVCAGDNFANGNVFSYAIINESSDYQGYRSQTTYQWRKNGAAITNQDFGGGRRISGTNTQQIQILKPNQSDSGNYDLVVIQNCYDPLYQTTLISTLLTANRKLKVNLPAPSKTIANVTSGSRYYWTKTGGYYDESGTYYNTTTCNLDTLVLTVVSASQTDIVATICQGQTYTWSANQLDYSQTGNYTFNDNGLTYRLNLTVRPRPNVTLSGGATICQGTSTSLTISQNNGLGISSGVLSDGTSFNGFGNSTVIIPVSPTTTTNYTVSSLTDGVCPAQASNISGNALVNVLASPSVNLSASAWDCGANIDSPVTVHLTLGGDGPWSGALSNGYSFTSFSNTVDIPVSYASGSTIRVASLYNQAGCYAIPSMLTGSLYIPVKSSILYVNPSDNTPFYVNNYTKSQKLCRSDNWTMRPIIYRVINGDSLVVSGLPSGVTASFMNTYSYNDLVGRSQSINKALVISGAPSVEGVFRYYVSVPTNAGCGIAIDSGVITHLRTSLTLTQGSNNQTNALSGIPIETIQYVTANSYGAGAIVEGLPPGVVASWNNNQLTISGTPTTFGNSYNYYIYLTDICGASWQAGSGTINVLGVGSNTPTYNTPYNRYACVGSPITNKIWTFASPTLNNGQTTVTGLPAGLTASWTSDSLTISGTPTQTGVFTFVISISNGPSLENVIEVLGRDTLSLFSGMSSQTVCSGSFIDPIVFRTNTTNPITSFYVYGLQNGINTAFTQNQASFNGSVIGSGARPYKLYVNGACNRDSIGGVITILDNTSAISLTSASSTEMQYVCKQTPIIPITYQSLSAVDYSVTGLPRGMTVNWSNQVLTISGSPIEGGDYNYSVTVYYAGNCGSTTRTGRIIVASGNTVSNTLSDTLNVLNGSFSQFYLDFNTQNAINGNLTAAPMAVGLPSGLIAQSRVGNNGIVGIDLNGSPNDLPGYYNFTITSNAHCGAPTINGVVRVDSLYTYELMSNSATTSQQICLNGAITPVVYKASQIKFVDYIDVRGLPNGVSVRGATRINSQELDSSSSIVFCNISNRVYKSVYRLSVDRNNQTTPISIIIEGTPTQSGSFVYTISDNRGAPGYGGLTRVRSNTIIVSASKLELASNKDFDKSCRSEYTSLPPVNIFDIGDSSQLKNLGSSISPIVFGMGEGVNSITTTGLPAGVTPVMSTHSHVSDGLPRKSYEITGTPTAAGTFKYTVTVNGTCGINIYTGTIVIKQNATIAVSSGSTTQSVCQNAAITPVQFSVQNGGEGAVALGLPTGVTGSFTNGIFTISGTPQKPGTYNYVIKPVDTSYNVLDRLFPNIKVALGLRKLVKEYRGPAIRLLRNDGAIRDFGFVGEDLDTAAINTWQNEIVESLRPSRCIKLYDQSGNGADFVAPEPSIDSNGNPVSNYPFLNIDYEYSSLNNTERFPVLPRLSFFSYGSEGMLLNSRVYSAPYTTAVGLDPRANYGNVENDIQRTFFKVADAQSDSSVDASLVYNYNSRSGLLNDAISQMNQIGHSNGWDYNSYLFTGMVVFNKELSSMERDEVANLLDVYYTKYRLTAPATYPYKATGTITVHALPNVSIESPTSQNCVNDAVTLTAYGAQSYLWSDNGTGNIHVVNPQGNSTYSVIGTDQFGCSNTGSKVVPVISYITNRDTTICDNRSLVLTTHTRDVTTPPIQYIIFKTTYSDSTEFINEVNRNGMRMILGEIQAFKNGENLSLSAYYPDYFSSPGTDFQRLTQDGDDNTAFISNAYKYDFNYGNIYTMGEEDCISNMQNYETCSTTPFYIILDLGMPYSLDSIRIFTSNTYKQSFKVYATLELFENFNPMEPNFDINWSNYYQIGEEVMAKGSFVYDLPINSGLASGIIQPSYQWSTGETTPQITVNPTQTTTYSCTISGEAKTCTDQVVVTVNQCQPVFSSFDTASCEIYTLPWGVVVTESGDYVHTYNNIIGSDSIVTAHVVINQPSVAVHITDSGIDAYTWHGITYRTSGLKYWIGTNVFGCDSTVILDLTMTYSCPPTYSNETINACDSYIWNGVQYNSSGTYTAIIINEGLCYNIVTLHLTISTSTINRSTLSVCDIYTWAANGQTYTNSGSYTAVNGCATNILNLTVTPSGIDTTTLIICDNDLAIYGYTWPVNNTVYNSSGIYTYPNGCRTSVLNLTLSTNISATVSSSRTVCGSYTWPVNGQTYTASGTYTYTLCSFTQILYLTIAPSTPSINDTITACETYTWAVNGQTYTNSGIYTYIAGAGCATNILNLTITAVSANTTSASACQSYTWALNGQTYTNSGVYTSVAGCATNILNLTITAGSANTTTASACQSYTWSVNGQTYTNSGIYTSVSGCARSILNLTITANICTATLNITVFLEGFYTENGTMRSNLYDMGISTNDTETDSIKVNLWSVANLSSTIPDYSVKTVLHKDGTLTAVLPGATLNNSYYVALKHRNSIETWSAEPIKILSTTNYDFSTNMSAAFGNGFNDPMKLINVGKYAIYAGDVNQDGLIDLFDVQITENNAAGGLLFGYDVSDCNGDGLTDIFDLQLIENNSTLLLYYARPY